MTTNDRIAAVVVAHNGGDDLLICLESLLAQTARNVEVIVVDNASSDGSIERAESTLGADIRVIRRGTNTGYAAGANTGWRATKAPIIAIFNQDLTFDPDCLEQMRRALMGQRRDALVTPKLVLKSDPSRVNAIGNEVHLSGVTWCHGLGMPADDFRGTVEVTAISGAAFMARRALLEDLAGLEESYFMYMEDVDLSFRARLAGSTCLAACEAVAVHDWALALTPRKFGLLERNRQALWRRFVGASGAYRLVFAQAEAMSWMYAALRGQAYLKAKWAARRQPLTIDPAFPDTQPIRPWLSRRHPYEVVFRRSKLIAAAGGITDALVNFTDPDRRGLRQRFAFPGGRPATDEGRPNSAAHGRLIYLAGNDGTGKTTQAKLLLAALAAAGTPTRYIWLRFPQYLSLPVLALSRLLRVTRYRTVHGNRTGRWEFHRAPWLAHVLMWSQVIDAWLARVHLIRPSLARSEAVVLDRFVYDIVVDIAAATRDPRLLQSRPARLLFKLVQPADVALLDAPAATIRERRPDLAVDENLELRADLYRVLGHQLGLRRIDATRPADEIHQLLAEGLPP